MSLAAIVLAAALQDVAAEPPPAHETNTEARSSRADGILLYKKHRFHAAADEFRKAVDEDPQSAAAQYYLGYTLYKIGEPTRRLTPEKEESKDHFAKAFELDPLFVPTWSVR